MNIVFRTDASIKIGSGHVMRCLTLADALSEQGNKCYFLCRPHQGHLGNWITQKGYQIHYLTSTQTPTDTPDREPFPVHESWLDAHWQTDAQESLAFLKQHHADWIIVDHYALDYRWQNHCHTGYNKLMVIDDLADRKHSCDLLLDQTFGRNQKEYHTLVPTHCELLTGANYALLRPEFHQWRQYSLDRRQRPELKNILINLGGVDKDNITGQIMKAVDRCSLPESCSFTIVMGSTAPHIQEVRNVASDMIHPCQVLQGVDNMAELMSGSDLSIGAAGSTSWERCCLGLPTLMIVLAENQQLIAHMLHKSGAAIMIDPENNLESQLIKSINSLNTNKLSELSDAAIKITQGQGTHQLTQKILDSI